MTSTMKQFRCWSAQSVRDTVFSDIGAMPTDTDALFMAAHTTMELEHRDGVEVTGATGEEQVLRALLDSFGDKHRNSLIAVTGSSGAGKSHVVRWVHANLPRDDSGFHVLYVPRAVQTIRELLKRIVEGLPGEGGTEILERVDAAVGNTTPTELQDRLLEEIRLALTWTLDSEPAKSGESESQAEAREARTNLLGHADEQGKRRNGLADLVALPQVNAALLRNGGLLERFVASVYQKTSTRDEQQEGFTSQDLPLQLPGIRRALASNPDLLDLWNVIRHDPTPTLRLLDEALRAAAPRTLGFRANNGETLDSLFRRSRQLLREQGKELVLLFEDLVQFGLIDGELYDQFTTQPGADLAPLRVVFAVTDGPFDKLGETVRTRITHHFKVNQSKALNHTEFMARYLNLVRLGRAEVEANWTAAANHENDWLKNACDVRDEGGPCRFRDQCHSSFGSVSIPGLGNIGLYPYNDVALERGLRRRGESSTPRSILDVCVIDQLIEADAHIAEGTYPHERLRERFDFTVQNAKEVVLGGRKGEQAERLYRALVIWGDEKALSPGVADAFSLSLLTKGMTTETSAPRLTPAPQRTRTNPSTERPAEPARPSPLTTLLQWQNGVGKLSPSDSNMFRSILHKMVILRLDLDQDLFHTTGSGAGGTLLNTLFPSYSFVLADSRGREPAATSVRFDLTRSPEDVRVLIAARWFADHGHWDPDPQKSMWEWPSGYDPVDLMLTLEHRLEQWAAEVRTRFLRSTGGRNVARAAVTVRAAALLALGVAPGKLKNINDILNGRIKQSGPVDGWEGVDRVAREVLDSVSASELVAEYGAARQGDTGGPQLIDTVGLDADFKVMLREPVKHLRQVEEEITESSAEVAVGAHKLSAAVEKAADDYLPVLRDAVAYLATELGDCPPKTAAQAAQEVGEIAVANNLFRPANAVDRFRDAVEVLKELPASLPLDWRGSEDLSAADQVLAAQSWAGPAVRGAKALAVLKTCMDATRAECLRNTGTTEDLHEHTQAVRAALGGIRRHLGVLSSSEEHGG
ncbi:AAA family ATPase [Lentzea sp. NPDC055074]